jgi:hypothetical protein
VPRFYFHTVDGEVILDRDGTELPDMGTARIEAVLTLAGMLRNGAPEVLRAGGSRVWVTDDADVELFRLNVTTVTSIEGAARG